MAASDIEKIDINKILGIIINIYDEDVFNDSNICDFYTDGDRNLLLDFQAALQAKNDGKDKFVDASTNQEADVNNFFNYGMDRFIDVLVVPLINNIYSLSSNDKYIKDKKGLLAQLQEIGTILYKNDFINDKRVKIPPLQLQLQNYISNKEEEAVQRPKLQFLRLNFGFFGRHEWRFFGHWKRDSKLEAAHKYQQYQEQLSDDKSSTLEISTKEYRVLTSGNLGRAVAAELKEDVRQGRVTIAGKP